MKRITRIMSTMLPLLLVAVSLCAINRTATVAGQTPVGDQQWACDWKGSYTKGKGETFNLSYVLAKDDKGHWRGTVKYTNEDGDHSTDFKLIEIADTKFK